MAISGDEARLPDGINRSGLDHGIGGWWSLIRLLIIGGLLVFAFAGRLGTGNPEPVVAQTPAARIMVETPSPLRNGMFFETRISVRATRATTDSVIAIPVAVWNDVTINTMIPSPAEEGFERGYFLFRFGPQPAGAELTFKLDGQINPARGSDLGGHIEFRDGDTVLVRGPYSIRVIN